MQVYKIGKNTLHLYESISEMPVFDYFKYSETEKGVLAYFVATLNNFKVLRKENLLSGLFKEKKPKFDNFISKRTVKFYNENQAKLKADFLKKLETLKKGIEKEIFELNGENSFFSELRKKQIDYALLRTKNTIEAIEGKNISIGLLHEKKKLETIENEIKERQKKESSNKNKMNLFEQVTIINKELGQMYKVTEITIYEFLHSLKLIKEIQEAKKQELEKQKQYKKVK